MRSPSDSHERKTSFPSIVNTFITYHYSCAAEDSNGKLDIILSIKELMKNKNFILLFLCFNCIYGMYCAMGAIISALTSPYNYNISDNSVLCLVFLISGILTSFFVGTVLDKY